MSPRRRKRGPESAVGRRNRRRRRELTPELRRRKTIELLAAGLADMAPAVKLTGDAEPPTSPTSSSDDAPENSQESSHKALELSAETRLSVSGDLPAVASAKAGDGH